MRRRRTNGRIAGGGPLAVLLLCAVSAIGSAQQPAPDASADDEPPARYTVEIIVFTYLDPSSAGNEVFAPPEPLDQAPLDETLSGTGLGETPVFGDRTPPFREPDPEPLTGALEELPERARIELQRLEPEAFRMQEIYRKLRQLDAYRPILHAAWTQTTHDKAVSPQLPLRIVSDPPLGLEGSIGLYQSRFLHLDVDLSLDASGDAGGDVRRSATDRLVRGEPPPTTDEEPFVSDDAEGPYRAPVRYRIVEDRIMRDGEIRYFDHPRFGMIATVRRADDGQSSDTLAEGGEGVPGEAQ